ncbi:MAG: alkaline phosphatase D family protein [Proteobacteria bacterium]|nr:alkaline phosphatase D family protein [Burkholderiales bacterium]
MDKKARFAFSTRASQQLSQARRNFMQWTAGGVLGASTLGRSAFAALPDTLPNGVAAGDVTPNSAVLWARSTVPGRAVFRWGTDPAFATLIGTITRRQTTTDKPFKHIVNGLQPATTYYYSVTNEVGAVVTGQFRTPATIGFTGLRFGVSGDWRGELSPYPAIKNAPARSLDFFLELGDTIYADFPSPSVPLAQARTLAEFRAKHAEGYGTRLGENFWADLRRTTATFAMIDDHEVTNDFAGGAAPSTDPKFAGQPGAFINETPFFADGLEAFTDYNPVRPEYYGATGDARTANKRKLYRYRKFGRDAAMFLLDSRSFRDAPLPPVADPTNAAQISNYLVTSLVRTDRTLLGRQQVADLKADLLDAQAAAITWKFIMVPEPIQNLGVLAASDRFEGYGAERTEILDFILTNNILNVVFVTADIHGTLTNNLNLQRFTGTAIQQVPVPGAFEISTGSVAFNAPFGPTVFGLAAALGLVTPQQIAFYNASQRPVKDEVVRGLINAQIVPLGYPALGLAGVPNVSVTPGSSDVSMHTYGWTEFAIDAGSGSLTVTTYGIDFYSQADLLADPVGIVGRAPQVVSQFTALPL